MADEIFDRSYQAGRSELNTGIDALFRKVSQALLPAFAAIHNIEWDAPWKAKQSNKAKA